MTTASTVWRDYATDGDAGSGTHNPEKSAIRTWGTAREQFEAAFHVTLDSYGATGDGTTDDNAAWEAFKEYVIDTLGDGTRGPDSLVTLSLTRGKTYTYTNNRLAYGIPRLRINANGASLKCISTNATSVNYRPLNFRFWYSNGGDTDSGGTNVYGYEINTASAGASGVTCSTASEAGNFSAGDWVLIAGFEQMESTNPPDYRYFEYRVVETANSGTGVVTFTEPLGYAYRSDWPDVDSFDSVTHGAARILNLDRSAHLLTKYVEINDAVILPNPNKTVNDSNGCIWDGALEFLLNNVDSSSCGETVFGSSRLITANRCKLGKVELDKGADRVVLNDCEADEFAGGVGVKQLVTNGGRFGKGNPVFIAAENLEMNGPVFDNPTPPGANSLIRVNSASPRGNRRAIIRNPRVLGPNDRQLLSGDQSRFLSITFASVSSGTLLYTKSGNAWDDLNALWVGDRLVSVDGTAIGTVAGFVDHDATYWGVQMTWQTAVPSTPVTLYYSIHKEMLVEGGNNEVAWQRDGDLIRVRWSDRDPFWYSGSRVFQIFGRVERIRAVVTKASDTGSGGPSTLWFRDDRLGANLFQMDLTTAGTYEATPASVLVSPSGSTNTHTPANWVFLEDMRIGPRIGGSYGLAGTLADPQLHVEIIARPLA